MSKTTTSRRTARAKPDLRRMRPMTMAQIEAAARSDPDARPFSAADLARMKHTPRAKLVRRALGLTQEEFAARFQIPLGTLRDWEQGAAEPDQAARAYLIPKPYAERSRRRTSRVPDRCRARSSRRASLVGREIFDAHVEARASGAD